MSLFKRKYTYQGMVQFDEEGNSCICGVSLTWLDEISVEAFSDKKAVEAIFKILKQKYPEYGDMIQLF